MKGFIKEFREFINRGNVMDLAVGVIIGAAFQAIINSLVNDVIMPIFAAIFGGLDFSNWYITLGSGAEPPILHFGNLISAIINFLLMAFAIFLLIKGMNKIHEKTAKTKEEAPATTKKCPYCLSEIPLEATRCPHCTSKLGENEGE